MAKSSLLGVDHADPNPAGRDIDALGPSDNSDSGSDVQSFAPAGVAGSSGDPFGDHNTDTDSAGTGERSSITRDREAGDRDILPDRVSGDVPSDADDVAATLDDALVDEPDIDQADEDAV